MERDASDEISFFVGREPELRTMASSVRDAQAGHGRPVLLIGEPGIGKTRTVEEFVRRLTLAEGRVVWGRSPEQEGVPAFWPWLQVLRRHLDRCDDDRVAADFGPAAAILSRLLPSLRE